MTPPLSVVIPTFRRDDSLVRLLRALREQTLPGIEILIVDQNAPGFLEARCGEALDGIVHLAQAEPNVSLARNAGFLRAKAEVILFIDDDLVPDPNFCRRGVERLGQLLDVGCLCPLVITETGRAGALASRRRLRAGTHPRAKPVWQMRDTISAAIFFRSHEFRQTGGFDEHLFRYAGTAEDQELCLRMLARGQAIWLDTELELYHDESVPGGCELRTSDYWRTRQRCIKAWVFRARTHAERPGSLSAGALVRLARSAFLNRDLFRIPLSDSVHNARLLQDAIRESASVVGPLLSKYVGVRAVDHLEEADGRVG